MTIRAIHLPQWQYRTAVVARPNDLRHSLPLFVKSGGRASKAAAGLPVKPKRVRAALLSRGQTRINQIFGPPGS